MVLSAGGAGLVYFAHRDKTERTLEEAWQVAETAQQEAEEANRAKTDFLATMSHESEHRCTPSSETPKFFSTE